ncbi:hypothetical protein M231_06570 [Tremella mesenterica]|uniref:UBA domain-containing protein n=1 Tax=Tremella mesenterica TaxID=5217 RepID=A0A4Q1BF25_TREME|nr:hypothetical protein M231_06570 [Tremella mesenterica]
MSEKVELVDQLKNLGISERTALFALSKTNNDVERAADYSEHSSSSFFLKRIRIKLSFRHGPASTPRGSTDPLRFDPIIQDNPLPLTKGHTPLFLITPMFVLLAFPPDIFLLVSH